MIQFRQKTFSEYDAMKSLYEEMKKFGFDRRLKGIINSSSLIPVLKGNNIVIERFVISTSFGRSDKYRMYIKVGAKAKMPDEVRLPSNTRNNELLKLNLRFKRGLKQFSEIDLKQKEFSKDKNKNNGGGGDGLSSDVGIQPRITYKSKELLGETLKYDKDSRSLVLEFSNIGNAIRALNILPFGINYNIYLLDA